MSRANRSSNDAVTGWSMSNGDWTRDEVEATVADYFVMLDACGRMLIDECEWSVHWPGQAIADELHDPSERAAPDIRWTTTMGTVPGTDLG